MIMYSSDILNISELPKPLPKEELYSLIKLKNEGSKEAKDKLVEHNIRLVLYVINHRFATVNYDKEELVSIGNIGLIKAIDTFDIDKGAEFTTYVIKVIENEILYFLRKLKKDKKIYSLDDIISENKNGNQLRLEDIIKDDKDFVEGYETIEVYKTIRKIVKELPDKEREMVMLYFGFYDKTYTQTEIAEKFSISQVTVCRILNKTLKDIENILKNKEILDSDLKTTKKRKDRSSKSIYQLLDNYSKEQIDTVITQLSDEERNLITIRYGTDLENPVFTKLSQKQCRYLYAHLIPKIRKLLANLTKEAESELNQTSYKLKLARKSF